VSDAIAAKPFQPVKDVERPFSLFRHRRIALHEPGHVGDECGFASVDVVERTEQSAAASLLVPCQRMVAQIFVQLSEADVLNRTGFSAISRSLLILARRSAMFPMFSSFCLSSPRTSQGIAASFFCSLFPAPRHERDQDGDDQSHR